MNGYNPGYDIESSPNFNKDLAYGHRGEESIREFLEVVSKGNIEVKTDRYRNGKMVVETHQNPHGAGWKESGINVTTAFWWIYVYSLGEGFAAVSVERLKRYLRTETEKFNENTKMDFAIGSDNPSRGYLLRPEDVQEMLYNPRYDKPQGHQTSQDDPG